jgi:Ca2+-binding RTX toxin-like protein
MAEADRLTWEGGRGSQPPDQTRESFTVLTDRTRGRRIARRIAAMGVCALGAVALAAPVARADTEVSYDDQDGGAVLTIEGAGGIADDGVANDGVVLTTTAGGLVRVGPKGGAYEPLAYDDSADPDGHCALAAGAVVCDAASSAAMTMVSIGVFGGDDYVDTSGLTSFGAFTPANTDDEDYTFPVWVWLGDGNDQFTGGPLGAHIEDGLGADTVSAGTGQDYIQQPTDSDTLDPAADDHGDVLDAGPDEMSHVSYGNHAAGVNVTLDGQANDGVPGEDDNIATNTVRVDGTDFDDTLTGSATGQTLDGGDGNDTIDGGAGDDDVSGGPGNDVLTGGAGSDYVFGDSGGNTGDDILNLADGEDDKDADCGLGNDTVNVDAYPLDERVEPVGGFPDDGDPFTAGLGCETINRPDSPAPPVDPPVDPPVAPPVAPPVTPAPTPTPAPVSTTPTSVTQGLTVPKDAAITPDSSGAVKLAFSCTSTAPCVAKKLTISAKVGGKTLKITVKVPAMAPGKNATVKVKMTKAVTAAVRKAGKAGLKITLTGPDGKPVKLTLHAKKH